MKRRLKLAVRIVVLTLLVLVLGGIAALILLHAKEPPSTSPEIFTQIGHDDWVESVAWSPDGRTLASASFDNSIKLWDAGNGQLLRTLDGHAGAVYSIAWSPDGRTLASGSGDNSIKLWDAASGQLLRTLNGHTDAVLSVAWNPNNDKTLASGGRDKAVILWDTVSGQPLRTLGHHDDNVISVAWSPAGDRLASGGKDKTIHIWSPAGGPPLYTIDKQPDSVLSVAWSPAGKTLASGGADSSVRLWRVDNWKLLRTLTSHTSMVYSVAWSRDGTLASGSADNTVKLWNVGTGQVTRTLTGHFQPVKSVAWSRDGTLASGSGDTTINLWDPDPDSSQPLLRSLGGHSGTASALAWSPDDSTLASGSDDETAKLWDVNRGQLEHSLSGHSGTVFSVAWNPDGKTKILATGSDDNTIKLWNASTGQVTETLTPHSDAVGSVAWNTDGSILASGSADKTINLWDVKNHRSLGTLYGHTDWVGSVAWSPDGQWLASGGDDLVVIIWNLQKLKSLRSFPVKGHVKSVAWSPDGKWLAAGREDNTINVWDPIRGRPLHTFSTQAAVTSVAWRFDSKVLASSSQDGKVSLWDPISGKPIGSILGADSSPVTSVAWSHKGDKLATSSRDGRVCFWDPNNLSAPPTACFHQLPGNEWLAFRPGSLPFSSSLRGDQFAAVRFADWLRPVYPLTYYRSKLYTEDLTAALAEAPRHIEPNQLRYFWDNFPNKGLWFGGIALVYCSGLIVVLSLARFSDPAQIARQFFRKAGFERVSQVLGHQALALRDHQGNAAAFAIIYESGQSLPTPSWEVSRTYVVYREKAPPAEQIHALRQQTKREIIPLDSAVLSRALSEENCPETLRDLEEPFVARTDPYDESRPIVDPTWFYGRREHLDRLPSVLRQGQHVGLFGMRKMGKTSLVTQIRQHMLSTPTVWIDCQAFSADAAILFAEIGTQLHRELRSQKIAHIPAFTYDSPLGFRKYVLDLHERWQAAGRHGPFVLILDEADKLFPDRRAATSNETLAQWAKFFRTLRGMAQETRCLAIAATAYRPDLNRQNLLTPEVGENPMFMSFQEYFLGALDAADTELMIGEIGGWKEIHWSPEALVRTWELCGGHPLVTRFFASEACDQGDRKEIDLDRVNETADAVRAGLHKHRIGTYYYESVWKMLQPDEREALAMVASPGQNPPDCSAEAVTHLEQFGLLHCDNGSPQIAAELLLYWLRNIRLP
jgi:WD40 repeat protein